MKLIIILSLLFSCCHYTIPYKDDITYMASGEANYPNYLVIVDDRPCIDSSGEVGMCIFKKPSNKLIHIKIYPQTYSYRFDFRCGSNSGIFFRKTVDVLPKTALEFDIDGFETMTYFNCIGDVFPKDRKTAVSGFFEMRVRIYNPAYIDPPDIYSTTFEKHEYLVFGENAYSVRYTSNGKWSFWNKKTTLKDPKNINFAIVETVNMRRKYYKIK